MKKRVTLLLILFLTLFSFCGRVEADDETIIWKTCKYYDDSNYKDYEFVVLMSGDSDKQEIKMVTKDKNGNYNKFKDFNNECWIKDIDDKGKKCKDVDHYDKTEIFDLITKSDKCPSILYDGNFAFGETILAAGTDGVATNKVVVQPQYTFYSADTMNNTRIFIGEGYNAIGGYYLVISIFDIDENGNLTDQEILNVISGTSQSIQINLIEKNGYDFFDVASGFKYQLISLNSIFPGGNFYYMETDDENEKEFEDRFNYKIIFDSNKNIDKLHSAIDAVLNRQMAGEANSLTNTINILKNDYMVLTNSCNALNEKLKSKNTYMFSNSYTVTSMVDDLENALYLLSNISEEEKSYTSCITDDKVDFYSALMGCTFVELTGAKSFSTKIIDNKYLRKLVLNDVQNYVENSDKYAIDLSKTEELLDEYTLNYLKCVSYLDSNYDNGGFVDSEGKNIIIPDSYLKKISDLRGEYEEFSKQRNIYFVVDCKGLLGSKLVEKIRMYVNIIKISVPILLIVLGIVDFLKVIFTGNDDQMKKSQITFFKRIGIAILIFFVPTIVEFILNIANQVWSFISPDSCGLF